MDELTGLVLEAKTDERRFAALAEQEKGWILRCASQAARRYVTDSDDAWSAALIAFDEAVRSYDADKGDFHAFASVVIRRRVVDELRSEGRHSAEVPVTPGAFEDALSPEEAGGLEMSVRQQVARRSLDASRDDTAQQAREEIGQVQEVLEKYGFSFFDLAECSPKAEKTKKSCAQAVRTMLSAAALLAKMRLKRLLPIRELTEASGVIRKILERHRKYIIASTEILDGDFPILASYLAYIRKG